jgi:protein-S-isoprenylcysteine O-methyltransferase Ste14
MFLVSSTIIASIGFYLLKYVGKPKGKIENTSNLITVSLYKYIRHPLYLSLILFSFGAFFKHIDIFQSILLILNIISLILTAKVEEKELINKFGNEYKEYINKTKMFIPYVL